MPLPLLSRPTTDTIRPRSPSPFATPATKPQIPTIRLTTATPADADTLPTTTRSHVAPWTTETSPAPIAPKPTTNGAAPRRRLVPKKSKLSVLGSSTARAREQDLSDVVRRVGGESVKTGSEGFEIYVDAADDPDIGDILMVKKKKSRAALDGMHWGALGEVTNVSNVTKTKEKEKDKEKVKGGKRESLLKVKTDENQRWWSIGRGRKLSKEKEPERAKSPQPAEKPAETRTRFNSLDSGILLTSPVYAEQPRSPVEQIRVPTPPSATLAPPKAAVPGNGKDSVALRAMRSVRSLARIGSWAQLRNTSNPEAAVPLAKDKDPDAKKKKKKEKEKEKEKPKQTLRHSGSSFEVGALSPPTSKYGAKSLGRKTSSILGLGLPSTMRMPSSRSGSTTSSIVAANTVSNRLSVDSAAVLGGGILTRGRSGSTMSTASSLRPMSASSCVSGSSSGSSAGASVQWDEAGLETVREIRRKDREARRKEREETGEKKKSKKSKSGKDSSRKTSDSRRRTPLASIFSGTLSEREEEEVANYPIPPIVTIEEATIDGHEMVDDLIAGESPMETPVKRSRGRPMSEQLIGRDRPRPIYEGDDDNAVLSLLDAATNDLAQLINRLDLEATPGSMDVTPMSSQFSLNRLGNSPNQKLATESPVRGIRVKTSSMTSLRPYAQTCSRITGMQLGQNIAPWSALNAGISPSKPSPSSIRTRSDDNTATLRLTQRLSPAPAADPSPVFKALRPATTRLGISKTVVGASSGVSPFVINAVDRSPSSLTFGSGHSKSESHGSSLAPSPVFKKAGTRIRKRSSLVPEKTNDSPSLPIPPEARRSLGLAGTMGGSIGSNAEEELDASDPDSDIPDELQFILSNSDQEVEDTISFDPEPERTPLPSPGLPPEMPLPELDSPSPRGSVSDVPIFRVSVVDEDYPLDVEEVGAGSEDDTKKSFDFTGELQKLNESGVSDRRSFIEQLENAFRTPAKIDLNYNFANASSPDVPPVPELPTLQDELSRANESSFNLPIHYESRVLSPIGLPVDVNNLEPSLLPGRDSFATTASDEDLLKVLAPLRNITTVGSRPSDGELRRDFKFGGKRSSESEEVTAPLTLSDIIPPPEVARSLSMASFSGDESALLKSIFAKAIEIPSPPARQRLDSDSSFKRRTREFERSSLIIPGHRRDSSMLSFAGFDSFAEVRRGFEFHDSRPSFYPPSGVKSSSRHARDESIMSFASVSSYGHALNSGLADPFDYASLASLRGRPVSDEFSVTMSTTVDDTFSFIRRQPRRHRVDSDVSSFYCRLSQIHPYSRNHRCRESGISIISPPVSLYNRSFGAHRRGDSSTSISSIAQSYAMGGASSGRASWAARHRPQFSIDSTLSDFTGTHPARPGLGDKMLESALDHGIPLAAISASPPGSLSGSVRGIRSPSTENDSRSSYDSIMDSGDEPQKTLPEDSLFDKTGQRTTASSDSTFFEHRANTAQDEDKLPRYRPISSLSIASVHSPPNEDDTMISMFGGGHVRRRSVTSMIGSSPCIRVERRKNIVTNPPETVFERIKSTQTNDYASPEKSRVIESKPSIASTTCSGQFGDERMIRARHGLLERQSLENTVLVAEGQDISGSFRLPVFTRPTHSTRSRSSTCTSTSGAETPPLSISDGYSSFSEASQSSIDLSQLNQLLSNVSHSQSNASFERTRPPTRGHRRRISQARASRSSIYETIQEEFTSSLSPLNSPARSVPESATKTLQLTNSMPMGAPQVFIVDPETSSVESLSLWDDEQGIAALRKFYALRDEAQDTVTESKRTWLDTPLSLFALQSFDPPRHPVGMRALLEHSRENYGPLSSDLHPRRTRSRVNSRPSPYPRTIKTSFTSISPPDTRDLPSPDAQPVPRQTGLFSGPLHQVTVDSNVPTVMSSLKDKVPEPKGCVGLLDKAELTFGLPPRPRENTRRPAVGWTKKSTGKENNTSLANISLGAGQTSGLTPSDGLRLSRPRPRGRPTPAPARPIRA